MKKISLAYFKAELQVNTNVLFNKKRTMPPPLPLMFLYYFHIHSHDTSVYCGSHTHKLCLLYTLLSPFPFTEGLCFLYTVCQVLWFLWILKGDGCINTQLLYMWTTTDQNIMVSYISHCKLLEQLLISRLRAYGNKKKKSCGPDIPWHVNVGAYQTIQTIMYMQYRSVLQWNLTYLCMIS